MDQCGRETDQAAVPVNAVVCTVAISCWLIGRLADASAGALHPTLVTKSFLEPAYFDVEGSGVLTCSLYASTMEERRTTQRQRVFKAGTIAFDGSVVDCTIRNVSPSGAALDVASPLGIPHEVTLNMLGHNAHQLCYVVWRKEKRIGVAFA